MSASPREALLSFGWLLVTSGLSDAAESVLSQALASARSNEDTLAELAALQLLGQLAVSQQRLDIAASLFREVLKIGVRNGDQSAIASGLHNHGELALSRGETTAAVSYFAMSAHRYRRAGNAAAAERTRLLLLQLAYDADFA